MKIYIDPYTRVKTQGLAYHLMRKYRKLMFVEVLANPEEQHYWDKILASKAHDEKLYAGMLEMVKKFSWYNQYNEVMIPEVNAFAQRRLDGIIKHLRQLKKLK